MKNKIFKNLLLLSLSGVLFACSNNNQMVNTNSSSLDDESGIIEYNYTTNNVTLEYHTNITLSSIFNSTNEELSHIYIDTDTLGNNTIKEDINNNHYIVNYEVKDTTKPMILGSSTISVYKGSNTNIVNKQICIDNYTSKPNCYIDGSYNLNKIGKYKVTYVAIDENNNKSTKNITINVKKKSNSTSSSSSKSKDIQKYIDKYKNDNTLIGIDVSSWQGNINFSKVKKDGVEAAIIRLGYGSEDLTLDSKFKRNLKGFKEENIKVGVYYYSYAKSEENIINEAKYIIKQLNGESLDLPIALDWENWSKFNKYNLSIKELNDLYKVFKRELNNAGYDTMLYSSAYYLNRLWETPDNTWVAYYTDNNDFKKEYMMWQATSHGKVNGISGTVDINIIYKDKIKSVLNN